MRNFQLKISAFLILAAGLWYGAYPARFLPWLFAISAETTDAKHLLRAIMGLYLAMGAFWLLGSSKERFWITATLSNIVFMGGLGAGRLISFAMDGFPSIYFTVGCIVEWILAFWGIYNLKKQFALQKQQPREQ